MHPFFTMSYLDSLENSLNSLERQGERDHGDAARQRTAERSRAVAVQPWAEKLKSSEFTKELFNKSAVIGHRIRAKIYVAWIDERLRLEARGRVLELKPTAAGIVAEYTARHGAAVAKMVDLNSDPGLLLDEWLHGEEPFKRSQEEMEANV